MSDNCRVRTGFGNRGEITRQPSYSWLGWWQVKFQGITPFLLNNFVGWGSVQRLFSFHGKSLSAWMKVTEKPFESISLHDQKTVQHKLVWPYFSNSINAFSKTIPAVNISNGQVKTDFQLQLRCLWFNDHYHKPTSLLCLTLSRMRQSEGLISNE